MKVAPQQNSEHIKAAPSVAHAAEQWLLQTEFDDICQVVAEVCHSPLPLVAIIGPGKDWFWAHHPLMTADLAADFAFCTQAMHHPKDVLVITDLLKDYRFGKHLLVTAIPYAAFYCGVPLVGNDAQLLGVLCIWDTKPKELAPSQVTALQSLAHQVASKIEIKKELVTLQQKNAALKAAYTDLESFTTIAAHDLKSPLNAIISLTDLLANNYAENLDEDGKEYIHFLYTSALNLSELVTAVLNYSRSSQLLSEQKEDISFSGLVNEITRLLLIPSHVRLSYSQSEQVINTNRTALKQMLMNLVDNAVKYNDKEKAEINIELTETQTSYIITVADNGTGISAENREKVFELFKKSPNKMNNVKGMGIGLAIVKRLAERLGGNITLSSEPTLGCVFTLTLPK